MTSLIGTPLPTAGLLASLVPATLSTPLVSPGFQPRQARVLAPLVPPGFAPYFAPRAAPNSSPGPRAVTLASQAASDSSPAPPSPVPAQLPVGAVPVTPPVNPHSMATRAKRDFRQPVDQLILVAPSSPALSSEPTSVRSALTDPRSRHAMEEEYDALVTNRTWDLVPRPSGANVVTDKWI